MLSQVQSLLCKGLGRGEVSFLEGNPRLSQPLLSLGGIGVDPPRLIDLILSLFDQMGDVEAVRGRNLNVVVVDVGFRTAFNPDSAGEKRVILVHIIQFQYVIDIDLDVASDTNYRKGVPLIQIEKYFCIL